MKNVFAAIGSWVANHKKLTTTLLASGLSFVPDNIVDQATKQRLIEMAIAYIVGQGIADHGKEAALIQAGAAPDVKSTQKTLFPSER